MDQLLAIQEVEEDLGRVQLTYLEHEAIDHSKRNLIHNLEHKAADSERNVTETDEPYLEQEADNSRRNAEADTSKTEHDVTDSNNNVGADTIKIEKDVKSNAETDITDLKHDAANNKSNVTGIDTTNLEHDITNNGINANETKTVEEPAEITKELQRNAADKPDDVTETDTPKVIDTDSPVAEPAAETKVRPTTLSTESMTANTFRTAAASGRLVVE